MPFIHPMDGWMDPPSLGKWRKMLIIASLARHTCPLAAACKWVLGWFRLSSSRNYLKTSRAGGWGSLDHSFSIKLNFYFSFFFTLNQANISLLAPFLMDKSESCLELFPDYVRHCARNLRVLVKKDIFCGDYSLSCLGGRGGGWVQRKREETGKEEMAHRGRRDKSVAEDGEEEGEEHSRSPVGGARRASTRHTHSPSPGNASPPPPPPPPDPDQLPPLDFSLRRPPPAPGQFRPKYISNFCCRLQERFRCLCHRDHSTIGSYGAAFCPTYSERCNQPLADWKAKKQNKTGERTEEDSLVLTCKQIKLNC